MINRYLHVIEKRGKLVKSKRNKELYQVEEIGYFLTYKNKDKDVDYIEELNKEEAREFLMLY